MTAPETRRKLDALTGRWPVGTRVRHTSAGWTARVVADVSGDAPGVALVTEPAHAVAGIVSIVHVEPEPGEGLPPMWMNERCLVLAATPAAPRAARTAATRTRRRTR
ncbi:hypothetical protein [Actinomadura rubrisoli]|uniref:Uncharacterized protein n=1 Tax=Actinomadura rubrisoli TaxID=2530368 RepID=A0A4R5A8K9_9ACTN|nr:hypothetical protein [Actinomadura rubrisoli]TDD68578.1 hypothetical protein E1298_38250 [Actinomadura rubrisoli]